ncbi:Rid family detoxifying hydrolase [Nocardioides sp.]|uniref:RidA family protein n=1 Tax=Nocardioides sp. TaxID=35761 RepID=UPI0031FF165E|nr:endoribonuclease [Nocardioides sp.]
MTRTAITSPNAPEPAGPYSHGVVAAGIVAVAGQVGIDPTTGKLVGDDVTSQTRQAIKNLEAVLLAAGSSLDDVIRIGVFLTEVDDFAAMNEVYAQAVPAPHPARTTVYVGLPPGYVVEVDALAVVAP